jgi:hypothetical protein
MPSRTALAALTTAALAAGCSHAPRPQVARATGQLRCEDAARVVAARTRTRPLDDLRRSATLPLSLVASGAGWVTDGAIVVTVGTVGSGLVCAPLFLLEAAAKGDGSATGGCVAGVSGAVFEAMPSPGLGRTVFRATRSWRCPDFVQLSREVRAVAACYASRAAPGDHELAFQHLEQLRADREIWGCLPGGERGAVDLARARLLAPPPAAEPLPLVPASPFPPPSPEGAEGPATAPSP